MFVVRIVNFGSGSAQVNIVGSINESVRPLPALSRSINQNSVTVVPETGVYYANLEGQNMAILTTADINTCLQNPNFIANGSAFTFQAYDSSLGNGTGQEAKEKAAETKGNANFLNWVKQYENPTTTEAQKAKLLTMIRRVDKSFGVTPEQVAAGE